MNLTTDLPTYLPTYLRTYIYTYIHTDIQTYIHTYTHIHRCIQTHIHIYTNIHRHIHTYIHTYMHVCIHTYIRTCTFWLPVPLYASPTSLSLSACANFPHGVSCCLHFSSLFVAVFLSRAPHVSIVLLHSYVSQVRPFHHCTTCL